MEDFEYSVEICDRDWECFFAECEECNLLPPSLAGVDDSGMSDLDDTGSLLAKRVHRVNLTAGFSEADRPIDGPPDCEGSPVEHYLSKHVIGGLESVLSGSEEDIHLQSVNIFYERLKKLTEAERLAEPCQVRENREAVVETEQCSDGQQSSGSTLPKNIPKLNSLPARGMVTNVKWMEEQSPVLQLDVTSINKSASQESSPSASIKRKRRKKRRLSFQPAECAHGYERRVLKSSDSEEEQYTGRGGTGLSLSEEVNLFSLNEPQKNIVSSLYSVTGNLPLRISAKEIKAKDLSHSILPCDGQYQFLPDNILVQGRFKESSLAEVAALSQTDDNVMSATSNGVNVETNLQPCIKLQVQELIRPNKRSWLPVTVPGSVFGQSDMAREMANSERKDNHADSLKEPDKLNHYISDQFSSALVKTLALNAKPRQFKTRARPFSGEISNKVTLISNDINSLPDDKSCLSESASDLDKDDTIQQTKHLLELQTVTHIGASQLMTCGNPCPSGEMYLTGSSQREIKLSTSKELITSPSDVTPGLSCCSLHTESVMSLSNDNVTDLSGSFCSSVSQNQSGGQVDKPQLILAKHKEGYAKPGPESQSVSNSSTESKCGLLDGAEDAVTASGTECRPDSKHSVFAMSSFWSEMEKLTISDILGLRMISEAAPSCCLPPLQESQEMDVFATTDSGFCTQMDESKPKQTNESVRWESEPVPMSRGTDIYPENMMLTSVSDISQPVLSESAHKSPRKISKNVSVHNLHALESFSSTCKGQTLQTLDEGESESVDRFSEEHVAKQAMDTHSSPSSLTDSYRISITDVFQYLFGGKQSTPSQSTTDNITTVYADGNSVPETYDHFFSEFDTENFFCPLITADVQAKDELVPLFSYSRSASRNLQFPEVYDCLFASSSSDDSSVESDDEEDCGPVRVVTRFSRKASTNQISTDIYENFFTDSDLRQNFFCDTTLSFRNRMFPGFTVRKQTLSHSVSPVPVRQSPRSLRRTVFPSNVLGNQDVLFPDPLLYHLENRIPRQQAQQHFRCEDLQTALSNPRLDTSLLPLRQADMCLVCIAFASWVLKTANPQVGDAWKAVLLANVSALSAIGYLRKYVKKEAADSEKKNCITPPHLGL
ncbi:Hypothetical protein SMAX5B_014911 [Scophthalmus maximus]|uniref:PGC-1 and ERR-induced regulator in muscle protein 1 n=1 Tax=Scophthalmus maximus TaxID=52904 RepID=A0A2U9BYZ1_SCOMX|nr:Hypothetical protein SMAX5B_014911 [Scophthalmus maximus]